MLGVLVTLREDCTKRDLKGGKDKENERGNGGQLGDERGPKSRVEKKEDRVTRDLPE